MSGPMSYAFFGGLLAYLAGAVSPLIAWREPKWARLLCCRLDRLETASDSAGSAGGGHEEWPRLSTWSAPGRPDEHLPSAE